MTPKFKKTKNSRIFDSFTPNLETDAKKSRKHLKQKIKQPSDFNCYKAIQQNLESEQNFFSFKQAWLRLAITLLFITGARLSEILTIKKKNIETLFTEIKPCLEFETPSQYQKNHKVFLTPHQTVLALQRKEDWELIQKISCSENPFLFGAKNKKDKHLSREYFTREINNVLSQVGEELGIKLTSHSFRKGYITKLYEVTNDVELISNVVGHKSFATTQKYFEQYTEDEIKEKMSNLIFPVSETLQTYYNKQGSMDFEKSDSETKFSEIDKIEEHSLCFY